MSDNKSATADLFLDWQLLYNKSNNNEAEKKKKTQLFVVVVVNLSS